MAETRLWTFQDVVDRLLDRQGLARQARNERLAREAVLTAYRDLPNANRWLTYDRRTTLQTEAQYTTGTIAYDHCVTPDHEALTLSGWKRYDELIVGERILAYDHITQQCRWEALEDVHCFQYDGPLLESRRRGAAVLKCTPNHRHPCFKRCGGNKSRSLQPVGFIKTKHLTFEHSVPLSGKPVRCFDSQSALSIRDAAILGWAVTDGTGMFKTKDYVANIVQSPTANPDNCRQIAALTGTPQRGPYDTTCASWGIPPSIVRRIKAVISRLSDLPWLVTRLSYEAATAMYESMLAAEGSCTAAGRLRFSQWGEDHKPIAEAFQILAVLTGHAANFRERHFGGKVRYDVTVRTSRHFKPKRQSEVIQYNGLVWCPKVISGAWIVQCDGYVSITGNSGGASERLVTLSGTGAQWPDNAAFGRIIIADTHYNIATREGNTTLTLPVGSNPGADVAAGTTYTWYRSAYPLPIDFRKIGRIFDVDNEHELAVVISDIHHAASIHFYDTPDTPWQVAIRNQGEYYNSMSLEFGPPPSAAREYDFIYEAQPRQLNIENYNTGTVTITGGTTAVTGNTTVFPSDCVGSVIRFGDASNAPTSVIGTLSGTSRYAQQRTIIARGSDTALTIDATVPDTLTTVNYTISDPIDLEVSAMFTAFMRMAEYEFAEALQIQDPRKIDRKKALADLALIRAMEADQRFVSARGAVRYNRFTRVNVTTDAG